VNLPAYTYEHIAIDEDSNLYAPAYDAGAGQLKVIRIVTSTPSQAVDHTVAAVGTTPAQVACLGTEVLYLTLADEAVDTFKFYHRLAGAWSHRAHPGGVSNANVTQPVIVATYAGRFIAMVQDWPAYPGGGAPAGSVQRLYVMTMDPNTGVLVLAATVDLSLYWPVGSSLQTFVYFHCSSITLDGVFYMLGYLSYNVGAPRTYRKIISRWDGVTFTPVFHDFNATNPVLSTIDYSSASILGGHLTLVDGVPWFSIEHSLGAGNYETLFYSNPNRDMITWIFQGTRGPHTLDAAFKISEMGGV
jgi:hypothetical protein